MAAQGNATLLIDPTIVAGANQVQGTPALSQFGGRGRRRFHYRRRGQEHRRRHSDQRHDQGRQRCLADRHHHQQHGRAQGWRTGRHCRRRRQHRSRRKLDGRRRHVNDVYAHRLAGNASYLSGGEWSLPTNYLNQLVQAQIVAENTIAAQLAQATPANINTLVADNTGSALTTKVKAASTGDLAPPALTISDAVQSGQTLKFTVSLSALTPSNLPVSVEFTTEDETAAAPADFTAESGTLTWAPGQTGSQTITVPIGAGFDPSSYFLVELSDPTNATLAKSLGLGATSSVSISEFSDATGPSAEAAFTVTPTGSSTQSISVAYQTVANALPGLNSSNRRSHRRNVSASETDGVNPIVITTSSPTTLATNNFVNIEGVTGFAAANGAFEITVINSTHFSLDNTNTIGSGTGGAWVEGDYLPVSGVLTWAAGNTTPQTIDVPVFSNPAYQVDKVFDVELSSPTNTVVNSGIGTAVIRNAEFATSTTLTSSAANNTSDYGQAVTFTATVVNNDPARDAGIGSVTFYDGTAALGTVALDSNGQASLTTSALTADSHDITATYAGFQENSPSVTFDPSDSPNLSETVDPRRRPLPSDLWPIRLTARHPSLSMQRHRRDIR